MFALSRFADSRLVAPPGPTSALLDRASPRPLRPAPPHLPAPTGESRNSLNRFVFISRASILIIVDGLLNRFHLLRERSLISRGSLISSGDGERASPRSPLRSAVRIPSRPVAESGHAEDESGMDPMEEPVVAA